MPCLASVPPLGSVSASCGAVEEAICTSQLGVVVPRPRAFLLLSQKKLVASPAKEVPLANCTAPVPPAALVEPFTERHVPFTEKHPEVICIPLV